MEKLVYVLWKEPDTTADVFREELLVKRSKELARIGARKLAFSVADSDVVFAQKSVISRIPTPVAGIASFWLDSHLDRAAAEAVLAAACSRVAGYLVLESVPIVNTKQSVPLGTRTPGVNTIGFLEKPERLAYAEWLQLWQGQHTRVAIETQCTFLYIQNVVVRSLTPDAPPWVAIVEEGFPREALTDQKVFYAAGDSDAVLEKNRGRMIESCRKFIEFDRLESHIFSQYVLSD